MKKIISFSLYNNISKYNIGAICNVELAKKIYPDWICRIYCGYSVPNEIIERLQSYDNCEVVMMEENKEYSYMMWRFLPIDDEDVEIAISRDADSRLSFREKKLVDIFINSDKIFHSIRDSSHHDNIMGGMWGIKKNDRVKISDLINQWKNGRGKGGIEPHYDQSFLREDLYPYISDSILTHCSYYMKNFPSDLEETNYFIGMWFYEDNENKPYDYVFY